MESKALLGLIDQLDGNLDGLEEALSPILEDSLSATTKRLPILDRAKLNITVVYAIESLLFCTSNGSPHAALLTRNSISQSQWRRCERAPCLQGNRACQAILCQGQGSRREGVWCQAEYHVEQAGSSKNNTALSGTRKR